VFIDLRDFLGALAGRTDEIGPFNGRLDIDEVADASI